MQTEVKLKPEYLELTARIKRINKDEMISFSETAEAFRKVGKALNEMGKEKSKKEMYLEQFLKDLRWVLIEPHEPTYTAEMKLRHILELYLRYIPELGGIKDESND